MTTQKENIEKIVADLLQNEDKFWHCFDLKFQMQNIPGSLPNLPGIYVVTSTRRAFCNVFDGILYVGMSSTSIKKRWRNHHKKTEIEKLQKFMEFAYPLVDSREEKPFSRISVACWVNPFADSELLYAIEKELVKRLNPLLNRVTPPTPTAIIVPILAESIEVINN